MHGKNGTALVGQRMLSGIALVFGAATIAAGASVLAGREPGYDVYRPLLIFNTVMGVVYVAAAVLTWRDLVRGRLAASVILALNLAMLGLVAYLFRAGEGVAVDSVRAMVFRSVVWFLLLAALAWLGRRQQPM